MGAKRKTEAKAKKPQTKNSADTSKDDDAELEAALAAIEATDAEGETGTEDTTEVTAEAETAETTEEVVDDESGEEMSPESVEAALAKLEKEEAEKPKKTEAAKKAKATGEKKPKAETTVPARNFHDVAAIDKSAFESARGGMAKKVGEKADNVVQAIERGKKLSRYTADAVKLLSQEGKVTAKAMCDAFLAANLAEGTARAQSQQMTALFKGIGLCEPGADKALTIKDQALLDELVKLAA